VTLGTAPAEVTKTSPVLSLAIGNPAANLIRNGSFESGLAVTPAFQMITNCLQRNVQKRYALYVSLI
jgi:hypothetical protein